MMYRDGCRLYGSYAMNSKSQTTKLLNYVNGKHVPSISNSFIQNINPATGEIISLIPDSNNDDVHVAVDAAMKALQGPWSQTSLTERSEICKKISYLIEKNLNELAAAESLDTGKPITLAKTLDIPRAASNFKFFAEFGLHLPSDFHPMDSGINYTIRQPVGVVGLITPWNLPLYLLTWKVAPALLMGNAIIAKPSEFTPTTASLLADICKESGVPDGIFNVIHGNGALAGQAIVNHDDVLAISFTGGTKTGSIVGSIASSKFKKVSLELGGKNPNIIFADCDLETAVEKSVQSSFANSGQICLCGSRLFIEESIYETFIEKFIEKVKKLEIGNPMNITTNMGSLISLEHRKKVESFIKLAREEGGKVLVGGDYPPISKEYPLGAYLNPTVITGLSPYSQTAQEEIFGPVVTLHRFKDEEDALKMANSVKYGLAASIWTNNLERAHRVAKDINAGIIWINSWLVRDLRTPFGGLKASGVGREGGRYSLDFFSESKNIYIHIPSMQKNHSKLNLIKPSSSFLSRSFHSHCTSYNSIELSNAPKPVGAYPHARRHGNTLYLSGIGPRQAIDNSIPGGPIHDANGYPLDYDIKAQTKAVIENIKLILEGSGSSLENVIDVQVFLIDMDRDFKGFNEVYAEYFSTIQATRTTCAIIALPTPIAVEFKVIASID